jgi:hypothetical protein
VQKHLRDIKASRYGPNYACNQESSLDFEQFDLPAAATKDANSPADDSEVSDAVVYRAQHLPTQHPTSSPPVLPGLFSLETTTVGCNNQGRIHGRLHVTTARNCALDSAVRLVWSMCCTR